ncbi:MAG: hypothetical protein PVF49_08740, partial [Anaerolineales bacterium]
SPRISMSTALSRLEDPMLMLTARFMDVSFGRREREITAKPYYIPLFRFRQAVKHVERHI